MRAAIIVLALVACQENKEAWKPVPADRSVELRGEALETFCKEQERTPGWTCDDFANCETGYAEHGETVCIAKQGAPSP